MDEQHSDGWSIEMTTGQDERHGASTRRQHVDEFVGGTGGERTEFISTLANTRAEADEVIGVSTCRGAFLQDSRHSNHILVCEASSDRGRVEMDETPIIASSGMHCDVTVMGRWRDRTVRCQPSCFNQQ